MVVSKHTARQTQSFRVQRDHLALAASLLLPAGVAPFPCVIFVHGLGSGKDSPRNVVIAERLVDAGIAALLFDLSGHGESDTDPRDGDEAFVEDLDAAFHWASARPEIDPERIGVAGSSLGALIALDATQRRLIHPAALVLRAPPAEHHHLAGINAPGLVVIGSFDPLFAQVREAVSGGDNFTLSVVPGGGHLFEEPGTLEEATVRTVEWFTRNLAGAAEVVPAEEIGEVD
jgi:dienelactone hydrolase